MRITREMCSSTSMITPLIGQRGEGIRSFRYCRALEFVLRSRGDAETADTAAETTDVLLGSHGARRHSVADAFSKRRQSRGDVNRSMQQWPQVRLRVSGTQASAAAACSVVVQLCLTDVG